MKNMLSSQLHCYKFDSFSVETQLRAVVRGAQTTPVPDRTVPEPRIMASYATTAERGTPDSGS